MFGQVANTINFLGLLVTGHLLIFLQKVFDRDFNGITVDDWFAHFITSLMKN
jgi:hypothetical protein